MLFPSAKAQFTALTHSYLNGAVLTKKTRNAGCQCTTLKSIVSFTVSIVGQTSQEIYEPTKF